MHRDSAGIRWRLISGNGRVLAMSDARFADAPAAREALESISALARAQRLVPLLSHPRSSVAWVWAAADGANNIVARGERVYGRHGTCMAAFRRFVALVASLDDVGGNVNDDVAGGLVTGPPSH